MAAWVRPACLDEHSIEVVFLWQYPSVEQQGHEAAGWFAAHTVWAKRWFTGLLWSLDHESCCLTNLRKNAGCEPTRRL